MSGNLGSSLGQGNQRNILIADSGGMRVQKQSNHADEARDGEDADAGKSLLPYLDLALGEVVARGQDGSDADPSWQQQAGILGTAGQVDDPRGQVGKGAANGEETHDGGLRGIVDEPAGHEAVGEEKGEVGRGATLRVKSALHM